MTTYEGIVRDSRNIIEQYRRPLTLRQLYYRLVAAMLIPNNLNMYKRLSHWMVRARENGDIDHRKIIDRHRYIGGTYWWFESPGAFREYQIDHFLNSWKTYTRNVWEGQKYYVEVWIEKDALADIVSEITDQHKVVMAIARGYGSFSFVRDALQRWQEPIGMGLNVRVLYLTDWDPAGEDMVRDLKSRISRYSDLNGEAVVGKIALVPDQIELYNLPHAPLKRRRARSGNIVYADSRAAAFVRKHGDAVVELDALEPEVLQDIVRRAIRSYIDVDIWNATIDRSQGEQQEVMAWLAKKSPCITREE